MRWDILWYVFQSGGRLLQVNLKGLWFVEEIIALDLLDILLRLDESVKMR